MRNHARTLSPGVTRRLAALPLAFAVAALAGCNSKAEPSESSSASSSPIFNYCDEECWQTKHRLYATEALDHAISDFTNRRPPSTPMGPSSPTQQMLDRLNDLRQRVQNAPGDQVQTLLDEARTLLDEAYILAVNMGMFNPSVLTESSANNAWWYISS